MSQFPEQPFSDVEERYVLAEVLKTSAIHPMHLQGFIEQFGIHPLWDQLALPNGRSVSACQRAITRLRERHGFAAPVRPPGAPENIMPPQKPKKRAPSSSNLTTPSQILPGFNSFPSVNNPSPAHGYPASSQSPGDKLGKKRGRPSKADHELRAAAAAARGEPYPPPKKIRPPKISGDQGGSGSTIGAPGDAEVPGSSGVKVPGEPQFALMEATASAANEIAQSGQPPKESETKHTDHDPPGILAGLQEHAARDTALPTESGATEQQQQQHMAQVQSNTPGQNSPHETPPTAHILSTPATQNEPYKTPYQPTSNV